ncbi:SWIM zinc finger family protein [Paenibacillus agricola]|uniref:SWIM-type domain-containing protein n=1 Tax=Paenibacillus agricola TaxID=2716264 RepID=A0ABX0JCR4_9BACL|nr:SWIM zinc finger family protein [Paenibacillus agricola]NHN34265.1 hypothetical protein [Paenibacillus agricola]
MLDLTYSAMIQQIRPYFDATILKRGWDYYREGAVRRLEVESDTLVKATVAGSENYLVRLDLVNVHKFKCDCPYGDYCKHMAAVLFEAFKQMGLEPNQFLKPDRTFLSANKSARPLSVLQSEMELGIDELAARRSQKAAAALASSQALDGKAGVKANHAGDAKPAAPMKKPLIIEPQESGTVKEWQSYFEHKFEKYPAYSMQSIEEFLPKANKALLAFHTTWPSTLTYIYELQVALFIMKRADGLQAQMSQHYSHYAYQYREYFRHIADHCHIRLTQIIKEIDLEEAWRLYPHLLEETAAYLAEHAFPKLDSFMRWPSVYSLLWSSLLKVEAWMAKECSRLNRAIDESTAPATIKDALLVALLLFDVLAGMDESAIHRANKELSNKHSGLFFPFLQVLYASEEWDRLILWLNWMQPLVKTSGPLFLEPYLNYWQEASKRRELEKAWKDMISFLLPASFPYYSQFLVKHERYQEWADLNLLFYRSPLTINKDILKLVEAHDVRFLLPLYHFAIERSILEKNRSSYKMAVRLLKKLHQFYKRLKELDRWDRYIAQISTQFSRYRAFQEELRKGKLIV